MRFTLTTVATPDAGPRSSAGPTDLRRMGITAKYIFGVLAIVGVALTGGPVSAKPNLINIVYDLNDVTMTNGKATPGFGEQLQIQLRDPRVRIHFFSSQPVEGIRRQLEWIYLPDGRTADRIGRLIGGAEMGDFDREPGQVVFKDLRVVTLEPTELANTILVDDSETKAHPGQTANLFWLPIDLGWPVEVDPNVATSTTEPTDTAAARKVNRRSDLMLGMIQAAINLADHGNGSVSEALYHLQWGQKLGEAFDPSKYRLDHPRTQAALIRYGARLRHHHGCADGLTAPGSASQKGNRY